MSGAPGDELEHWRRRAAELRAKVESMADPHVRLIALEMLDEFEALVDGFEKLWGHEESMTGRQLN